MNAANQPPKAILALDIGALVTRGFLFDIVGSSYHLTASAESSSTHLAPNFDIGEAIYHVVSRLQEVTGRVLMDPRSLLIMPVNDNSEGVDQFFITTSCAPELKIVAVGLLNEVSLESAKKLAYSVTGQLVDVLSINDRRSSALQMDAILAAKPDLIIFAGGTENGANRSLIRTADLLCGALGSLPRGGRPQVLFCGNADMLDQAVRLAEDYPPQTKMVNLGYLPGGTVALSAFVRDPVTVAPYTADLAPAWELPALANVRSLADFSAILIVTDNPENVRAWVEQSGRVSAAPPLLVVSSAQAAPIIQPYYDSFQVAGYLSGAGGAATYQLLRQVAGNASNHYNAYQFVLLATALLVVLGGMLALILPQRADTDPKRSK